MELSQTMMWILGIIFGIIISIFSFLFKTLYTRLEAVEKQSDANLATANEFKFNYLDRFSKVVDRISDSEKKIMDAITEIKEDIAALKQKQSK